MADTEPPAHRRHGPPPAAIVLVPLVVALVLTLFAWPQARLEPRDLPIGVAGAPAGVRAIEQRLAAGEGTFEVHRYADGGAARRAIEDRDVYGALVASPTAPTVLTASAASPAVAQLLVQAASDGLAPAQAASVRVQDVVPAPRGGALAASVLPLVIAGILTGVAATFLASGGLSRAGLAVAGAILSGLTATAIVQGWLDVVAGGWVANAAALSLTVLAIGAAVAGLETLLGRAGLILAALTMVIIGNPFSGVATGPELLPRPVGGIGQLLPPGAGSNLLRSTGYFDGAAAGRHVAVLAIWAVAGLAVLLVAAARERPITRVARR